MDMTKREDDMTTAEIQTGNRSWWTRNTMSYDFTNAIRLKKFSPLWFDEIDRRFIHDARLFATDNTPFDRILPFDILKDARVLELGCGMGLHTELMLRAGAQVTSLDLSPTSVEGTIKRLKLKGLSGNVMTGDAENLPFKACDFDFVWSWGVIHHSSRTARVVREIARVLSPSGSCRIMVYNREGIQAKVGFFKNHIIKGGFLHRSFEETLYRSTDGFTARFYVSEQFEDLFRAFFTDVKSEIMGQESDAVPLPRFIRRFAMPFFSTARLKRAQARRGSFIFLTASKPT